MLVALKSAIIRRLAPTPIKKTWEASQAYELEHAYQFMEDPHFIRVIDDYRKGDLYASKGHINDLILREFFENDPAQWRLFVDNTKGKAGLDIGPCVFSPLATWDFLARRIAIEPLGESISRWQKSRFGVSAFDEIELRSAGADVFMPDLRGAINGVIYCRNMLDHTPSWPFVLSNISAYAAPGCHLLLWTDIDHRGTADAGHYDICSEDGALYRMIQQFGFDIIRRFEDKNRAEINCGCFAKKKDRN